MEKMPCLPVKITDRQWAEKLRDGSVFMRSLYDYGSWSAIARHQAQDGRMKSGVQGDTGEGIVRRVDPRKPDEFFSLLPDDLRAVMQDAFYIDQERYQFYKVFCMYGLTYLTDAGRFEQPDARLREFGDTAVIFLDPNAFLERVLTALTETYGDNVAFRMDEVHYYPPEYFGALDEFCKSADFAWQNEMRLRVALLDGSITQTGPDGRVRKALIQSVDPLTLELGSLRDITVQLPVEDLIALHLPEAIRPPIMG